MDNWKIVLNFQFTKKYGQICCSSPHLLADPDQLLPRRVRERAHVQTLVRGVHSVAEVVHLKRSLLIHVGFNQNVHVLKNTLFIIFLRDHVAKRDICSLDN